MGNPILSLLPESVHILDVDVPFGLFVFVVAVILISGKLRNCCTCLVFFSALPSFRRRLIDSSKSVA